ETQVLVPGNIDKDLQSVLSGQVKEPGWWNVVHTDQVGLKGAYLGEVFGRLLAGSETRTGGVGREGAIGKTLDVKFLCAEPEEFTAHANARPGRSRNRHEV